MASTFTPTLQLTEQGTGDNSNTWGTVANLVFVQIDQAINGYLSINAAGSSNITLAWPQGTATANQANNAILKFTGALTGDIFVIYPLTSRRMVVWNATTGAHTLTVALVGAPGSTVLVPQGTQMMLWADGTNVFSTLSNTGPIVVASGGVTADTLTISGAASIHGSLQVDGSLGVNAIGASSLTVTGAATVGTTLDVVGAATIGGAMSVAGAATVSGNATLAGTASIAGAATVGGAMTVVGALVGSTNATAGNQIPNLSQFPNAGGNPMSAAFPGGVIKAGSTVSGVGGLVTIPFGTAFPTACEAAVAVLSTANPNGTWSVDTTGALLAASVTFIATIAGVGTSGIGFNWIATGY